MPLRFHAASAAGVLLLAACTVERPATSGGEAASGGAAVAADSATGGACDRSPGAADRTICLPDRVGPLTPATRRSELEALLPDADLRDDTIDAGEGMVVPGTIVNDGQDDEVTIAWTDTARAGIAALQSLGSAWRTPQGLGAGSSLDEIVAALGTVHVLGFGWDYGGTILLDGTALADRGLFLRTEPADPSARGSTAWRRVRGDVPFPSDDPDVRSLDLVVRRVDVRFP